MLNNFIGEYLVLQGAALVNFRWTVFAALGVILSACYMLWLYQRVFFGKASDESSHHMTDLTPRECAIMRPAHRSDGLDGHLHAELHSAISSSTAVMLGPVDAKRDVHVRNLPQPLAAQGALVNAKEAMNAR